MFAEQQGWEELGVVGDSGPHRKDRIEDVCLFASLGGSRWINSQIGGWLDGSCQCVSVSMNLDKATYRHI